MVKLVAHIKSMTRYSICNNNRLLPMLLNKYVNQFFCIDISIKVTVPLKSFKEHNHQKQKQHEQKKYKVILTITFRL